jgi:hypothetical protein
MAVCKQNRRGFTLTETAILLGVVSAVLAGLWTAGSAVWRGHQVDRAAQQVATVVQNMRDYYGPLGTLRKADGSQACSGASTFNMSSLLDDAARRIIPVDMMDAPDSTSGVYRHELSSSSGASFSVLCVNAGLSFRLTMSAMKKEGCARFLLVQPFLDPEMRIERLEINGTSTNINPLSISNPSSNVSLPLPLTVTKAQALCSSASANQISIDYKL